jgi:probable selenium-dependent hydroxylase accessory protein YqeC
METLWQALAVRPGDVLALVGGGGKTAALYRLGRELAARGVPVVLGGTARFTPPEDGPVPNLLLLTERDGAPILPQGPWPLTVTTGQGSKGRLLPVPVAWVDAWHARHPDWVIVLEADGSAMRPFKAPAEHEPVIPPSATLVVPVVGIDAVGRPLDATHVHRDTIVAALTGAQLGAPVSEELIAATLLHPLGGRKGVPPGARWVPLINKADNPERLAHAERLAALLAAEAERVVIARLKREPPVVRVVARE